MRKPAQQQEVEALGHMLGADSGFEALRRNRERVEQILQVVVGSDGVLLQDFSGRIVYANDAAAEILGCQDSAQLLRVPTPELLDQLLFEDEEGRRLPRELPGSEVLRGAPAGERTLRLCSQGTLRWLIVRTVPMRDPAGSIAAAVTVLRDITEQRQTAAFRDKIVGIVSHDLKNPLTAISLSAGLLERRLTALAPDLTKAAHLIRDSAERATRMVHDLLDLTQARLGGGIPVHRREVSVQEMVAAAVNEARAAHPDRRIVHTHEGAETALCDPDRINQVLANLMANALAYSPEDAPVCIHTDGRPEACLISVHNLGEPIPEALLSTLFEPFLRGNGQPGPSQRSVGLGLYIVKEIVGAHGGSIGVTSTAADGTRFTLFLPRN